MTGRVRAAVVVRVREESCNVLDRSGPLTARYATGFPSPRTERVSPGHLVGLADAADGTPTVVWRWYDAVVVGVDGDLVRLWEPAHGEVSARPRRAGLTRAPGTRAYLSAGLPGADWWVAGPVTADPSLADVELDAVERLYSENGLWDGI